MAIACDSQSLVTAAACQFSCLSGSMLTAIRLRLLCAIVNGETMTCDAQSLITASKCLEACVMSGMAPAIEIMLLCTIANGGGAGGGGVLCGVVNPVAAPTGACGIYYRTDTGAFWFWSGTAWIQFIV